MRKTYLKITILIPFIALIINSAIAQQWDGYTLYSVKGSTTTQLIDTNSVVYHTWTHAATATTGYSSYLMPGGILWRTVIKSGTSFTGGPICGEVQKVDYSGTILWDFVYSSTTYVTHHDICPLPNGNVLLIAYESKTAAEVVAAGCTAYSGIMWPDKIVEVQPTGATTGTIVWEWHEWDHLVQNTNASAANYQTSIVNHPELLNINYSATKDWSHMNGVSYNPILDQITFSSHNLSEIYVIDHSTTTAESASHSGGNSGKGGDILYRWGNPAAYSATGTKILNVVHDAHWIPEGSPNAGNLVGYNNGGITVPTTASCVDQFTPPVAGYNYSLVLGSAYTPSTYSSRQLSGGYNSNEGGSQQLPNGNTLLSMGISGYIKEFSPTGTLLWSKTTTGVVAKAFRYNSCYINNTAPAIPTISLIGSNLSSSVATTYQWYLNGVQIAGATNQTYTPSTSGIYVVRITDINGCVFEYSLGYNFTIATGINETSLENNINIYPNPTNGIVNIDASIYAGNNYEVTIFDVVGKLISKVTNATFVDLSSFG
ncbi:MAG: aryl-sulfate sulfotransferase, partial [Bacteroidetes bacterium]|nr:aryl-sulfate sulfotransferase [Bacteroidota bacterium]